MLPIAKNSEPFTDEILELIADRRRLNFLITIAGGNCANPADFNLIAELREGRAGIDHLMALNPAIGTKP